MKRDSQENIYSSSELDPKGHKKKKKKASSQEIYSTSDTEPKYQKKQKSPKRKKKKKFRIFLMIVVALLVLIVGLFFYCLSGLQTTKITTDPDELGISSGYQSHGVVNIALFGVDTRDYEKNTGRSDSIMVLSVNRLNGSVKISSILRDSRVVIDGYGYDKLAHAYAYGGAPLAIETLNENYNLDIQEYITVNFEQLAEIIDAVGGVDVTITEEERVATNGIIASTPGVTSGSITESGNVHLNGEQATCYARIRKLDSDSARASRQQIVTQALFDQIQSLGFWQYPKVIHDMIPHLETSLSVWDFVRLSPMMIWGMPQIETTTVPDPDLDNAGSRMIGGVSYWDYDLDAAADRLHEFIYGK